MAATVDPTVTLNNMIDRVTEAQKIVASLEREYAIRLANPVPEPEIPVTDFTVTKKQRQNQIKVGQEVARTTADIDRLRAMAPDLADDDVDDSADYYLAVGNLENMSDVLRSQLEIAEHNLASINSESSVTADMISNYQDLLRGLIEAKRTIAAAAKKSAKPKDQVIAEKAESLNRDIRATNVAYKKLKEFLSEFLVKVAAAAAAAAAAASSSSEGENETDDDDSSLAKLLQELWNAFMEDPEDFVDIGKLDFDLEDQVVDLLLRNGIIETKDDADVHLIKFVNFTE